MPKNIMSGCPPTKTIKNIGLDVHKNSIPIGIADDGRDGEVRFNSKIDNNMNQLDKVIRKLVSKGRCFDLYMKLVLVDMDCTIVAPSKIPQQSGNRIQRLTEQIRQQSQQSRPHELIKALQSMPGISRG